MGGYPPNGEGATMSRARIRGWFPMGGAIYRRYDKRPRTFNSLSSAGA